MKRMKVLGRNLLGSAGLTCALVLAAAPVLGFDWNRAFDKTLDFVDKNLESLQQSDNSQQNQQQQPVQAQTQSTPPPQTATTSAASRQQIQTVQRQLQQLGYDPGPADGVMGGRTLAAIRAFQTDQGLTPTGQVDASLEQELTIAAANGHQAPTGAGYIQSTPNKSVQGSKGMAIHGGNRAEYYGSKVTGQSSGSLKAPKVQQASQIAPQSSKHAEPTKAVAKPVATGLKPPNCRAGNTIWYEAECCAQRSPTFCALYGFTPPQ